jgi:hypothetical protein
MNTSFSSDDALELEQQMYGLTESLREIENIIERAGVTDRAAEWLNQLTSSVYGTGDPDTVEQCLAGAVTELKIVTGCADE